MHTNSRFNVILGLAVGARNAHKNYLNLRDQHKDNPHHIDVLNAAEKRRQAIDKLLNWE